MHGFFEIERFSRMSDLARLERLAPAGCQLPLAWYFDPAHLALERKALFDAGPGYVGHEVMVPQAGDYHTLAWMGHAKLLVRSAAGVALLSNVCRHRQALMLEGRGNAQSIVCPVHRWSYGLEGELLGAPHFPETPCLKLASTPLKRWNGMLFAGPRDPRRDLAGVSKQADFDFSGYRLDRVLVEDYPFNWKTFIEIYLELYHVEPFHPGLSNYADVSGLRFEYGEAWSLQILPAKAALAKPGTPRYRRWHLACLERLGGEAPRQAALWMTYYPNLMLEWYPNALVVSHVIPRSPALTTNVVEFYYPEEIVLFEREFVEAAQAAYNETAAEDGELCTRLDRGRRALHAQGLDEAGPYQSPMEDTLVHFHEWLRARLGQPAALE
jgi:phenylpropionate dioxygenase-like ring-hydroxylating dioxygenase large terminal subunit